MTFLLDLSASKGAKRTEPVLLDTGFSPGGHSAKENWKPLKFKRLSYASYVPMLDSKKQK